MLFFRIAPFAAPSVPAISLPTSPPIAMPPPLASAAPRSKSGPGELVVDPPGPSPPGLSRPDSSKPSIRAEAEEALVRRRPLAAAEAASARLSDTALAAAAAIDDREFVEDFRAEDDVEEDDLTCGCAYVSFDCVCACVYV